MQECGARRHGTATAYRRGCRCDLARRAIARYEKARNLDILHGQSRTLTNTGALRRLHALRALGWPSRELATRIGVDERNIARWPHRTRISRRHYDAVCRVYAELAARRGPDERARRHAARQGWLPPLAWDDETIDDPDYEPTSSSPAARRPRGRSSLFDDVDQVVVERLTSGAPVTAATRSERYAAYALLRDRSNGHSSACHRANVSPSLRTLFADTYDARRDLEETG